MAKAIKIVTKDIRKLRDRVRSLDSNWAESIAELMVKEGSKEDKTSIFNITNGIIRNPNRIRLFVICATLHLEKVEQEEKDTLNILKNNQ